MDLSRQSRLSLLALLLAAPLHAVEAQLSASSSITLMVTVPPRLSIRSVRPTRVEVRSRSEIEVVTEIEVVGNTRYTAVVRPARRAASTSAPEEVRVAIRNAAGGLDQLENAAAIPMVRDGYRSGHHEVRCVVRSDDPALVQPNRCAFVFEVTSIDGERLLRAAAVLDLEDALPITPRSSEAGRGDRE